MLKILLLLGILIVKSPASASASAPSSSFARWNLQTKISTGVVQGQYVTSSYSPFGNQTAIVFYGIPFAKPPVGNLRFRKAVPPSAWEGTLHETGYKPACMSDPSQTYKDPKGGPVSEDCLYLNVFTNDYCMQHKNCSVMAVIHGGRFLFESPSAFSPEITTNNFLGQNRNIVVVSIAYRMGAMGLFHLSHEQGSFADPNLALQDVLEGLRWVQKEVVHFGGLSKRVTIFGHSAGAAAVCMLQLSPLSKGLYHQQVIMSAPDMASSKEGNTKASRLLAIKAGCLSPDAPLTKISKEVTAKAIECLRLLPAKKILDIQLDISSNEVEDFSAPWVDGEIIPDYQDVALKSGQIEKRTTLIGTVTGELEDSRPAQLADGTPIPERVNELCEQLAYDTTYEDPAAFVKQCEIAHNQKGMPALMSDNKMFYANVINFANANVGPDTKTFVYSYSYNGSHEAFNKYLADVPSPTHSEDYLYLFGTHRNIMQPKDYEIERIYTGIFANFVNTGDPSYSQNQKWTPYTVENREYFNIDFDDNLKMPGMKNKYYERVQHFWNEIVPKYAGKLIHLEEYPPGFDIFSITTVITALGSKWANVTLAHDKSLETMERAYQQYADFLAYRKSLYPDNSDRFALRSAESDVPRPVLKDIAEPSKGLSFIDLVMWISGIAVVLVAAYIATIKFISWRRHRNYNLLN